MLVTSRVVTLAAAAVVVPIVVLSIVPALMSAVSAIKLSMLAVPSINRSRHSWPVLPKSKALSVAGLNSELTLATKSTVSALLLPKVVLSSTVKVVNAPVFGVVLPIVGGAERSKVPPKVRLPLLVTVPEREMPETVPVPVTLVTVPVVGVA